MLSSVISFLIVKRHHGNLDDALGEGILKITSDDKILEKQINTIDFEIVNNIYNKLFSKINFTFDCNLFRNNVFNANPIYIYGKMRRIS